MIYNGNVIRSTDIPAGCPFSLEHDSAYRRWRDAKLEGYPARAGELVVAIENPLALTEAEAGAMLEICRKTNMVLY
ncbi:MAG: hypothetical protein OEY27_04835, partial [Gammaproteobacteria bacterium]|nr:hypothetical protein [Gammaproteobacteria bacterium]